jgi:hypothetical protein
VYAIFGCFEGYFLEAVVVAVGFSFCLAPLRGVAESKREKKLRNRTRLLLFPVPDVFCAVSAAN